MKHQSDKEPLQTKFLTFIKKNKEQLTVYGLLGLLFIVFLVIAMLVPGSTVNQLKQYNDTAIKLGEVEIKWYALFIILGIGSAAGMAFFEFRKKRINSNILIDGLLIFVPLSILGARLYSIIFTPGAVLGDFFKFGDGGLAIYGAVAVMVPGVIIFSKYRKIDVWLLGDVVAPGFLIGQSIGRWGNFFNQEVYGRAMADNSFVHKIIPKFIMNNMYIDNMYRHPLFLYESLWNVIGLIAMLVLRRKKVLKVGDMMGGYLMWYGLGRAIMESVRDPQFQLGNSSTAVNIWISVGLVLVGALVIILKRVFIKNQPLYVNATGGYVEKTVIFDLDGTLIDSGEIIIETYRQTLTHFFPNINLLEEKYLSFIGPTLEVTFSEFANKKHTIEDMISKYQEINYDLQEKQLKEISHALELLKELKKQKVRTAVVTSKKKASAKLGLQITGLGRYIDVLVASDDVTLHKPSPYPINLAIQKLKVKELNNVMYVGDHPNDIVAARDAKIKSCGVNFSIHRDEVTKENPTYIIEDLLDILEIIKEWD